MPQFSANLSMLFTELPFLDRFEAAAKADFKAVEFLFPYEFAAETVAVAHTPAPTKFITRNSGHETRDMP